MNPLLSLDGIPCREKHSAELKELFLHFMVDNSMLDVKVHAAIHGGEGKECEFDLTVCPDEKEVRELRDFFDGLLKRWRKEYEE